MGPDDAEFYLYSYDRRQKIRTPSTYIVMGVEQECVNTATCYTNSPQTSPADTLSVHFLVFFDISSALFKLRVPYVFSQ